MGTALAGGETLPVRAGRAPGREARDESEARWRRFETAALPYLHGLYPEAFRRARDARQALDLVQEAVRAAFRGVERGGAVAELGALLSSRLAQAGASTLARDPRLPPPLTDPALAPRRRSRLEEVM